MKDKFQSLIFLLCLIFLIPSFAILKAEIDPNLHKSSPPAVITETPPSPIDEGHFYSDFANMMVTLGMLVGVLLLASWFLKRMTRTRQFQLNSSSTIKILEQRQLSARCTIHLVEVGNKTFILGESPASLVQLAEFPSDQE
jgi:flagellar biogenesis protein FliO